MTECPVIAQDTDTQLILSNYNRTTGTYVQIGCRRFGYRLQGPTNVTCLASGSWSANPEYKCEWTGVLNTYEKLVIGTAAGAGGLLLICLFAVCCFGWLARKRKNEEKLFNGGGIDTSYRDHQIRRSSGSFRKSGPYADHIRQSRDQERESGFYASRIVPHSPKTMNSRTTTEEESRKTNRLTDDYNGYTYYTGKKTEQQYDNRAFDHRNVHDGDRRYPSPDKNITGQQPGWNRNDYRWNGQIPRPHVGGQANKDGRQGF